MTIASDVFARTTRALPRAQFAHWLLRLPLAGVLLQYGFGKFPLNPAEAEGFGVPLALWALAGAGEIAVGLMLLAGGLLRGWPGDLVTRLAGAGIAVIVASVVYIAYWAPPLDLLLFNQFHLLLLSGGLYFALAGTGTAADPGN
jgi:putative oxidoreductase